MVKKILSILAWVVTAAALVVLFFVARKSYMDRPLQTIHVDIDRVNENGFVKKDAVLADLDSICHKASIGTINMVAIGNRLKSQPWIESASSFVDLDGNLNVSIKEYHPVLRVFDKRGQSAYLTNDGLLLPPSTEHTSYVLIASGNFDLDNKAPAHVLCDTLDADRNRIGAMKVLEAIGRNDFMKNSIGQIYCNRGNEFEIVARDINARIVLGDTCQLDDKLKRLEIFMKQKIGTQEIQEMKTINLKYKNQVVCTKR